MFDETTLNVPPETPVPEPSPGETTTEEKPVKKKGKPGSTIRKPKKSKKKALKKQKKGPSGGKKDERRVAIVELHRIRALLEEIVENYQSKLEADLIQIEEILTSAGKSDDESVKVDKDRIQKLISLSRRLDVKASKGRRKDLKRIDRLITQMHQLIQD